jgi:hypothetical protein
VDVVLAVAFPVLLVAVFVGSMVVRGAGWEKLREQWPRVALMLALVAAAALLGYGMASR